ncbi:hypothetical protein D3C85_1698530 [compost metagenome]
MQPLAELFFRYLEQREELGDIGTDNKGRFFRTQQQPFQISLFFEDIQRVAEAGHRRGVEFVD